MVIGAMPMLDSPRLKRPMQPQKLPAARMHAMARICLRLSVPLPASWAVVVGISFMATVPFTDSFFR